MTSKLSIYWHPTHKAERGGDIEFMRALQPYDILILQPDVQDVIDAHTASQDSEIVLRVWDWDDSDGNRKREMYQNPIGAARSIMGQYLGLIETYEVEMRRRGAHVPDRKQMPVHLWNEPDTNHHMAAINTATVEACAIANRHSIVCECLNFGTGHPALLVGGPGSQPDWRPVAPAIDAIMRGGHYAVTHEYYNKIGLKGEPLNPWHVMRHKWAPRGPKWKIGEFGFEGLVNNQTPGHQGWQGQISGEHYVVDIDWYLSNVRDDVVSVRIF